MHSTQHIPPLCHSSDVTHMSHEDSQNLRQAGYVVFPRVLPNDRCEYETAMTGVSWNAFDLKLRNSVWIPEIKARKDL